MAALDINMQPLSKDIDPRKNFEEWLKSLKVKPGLMDKMKKFKIDSMQALQDIDVNNKESLKELTKKMGLSTTQRLKFKLILKKIPQEPRKMDTFIDPEEQRAILSMEYKLKQIKQSMMDIEGAKMKIALEIEKCSKLIATSMSYDEIVNAVVTRKEILLKKLQEISNQKMVDLDKAYQEMKQHSIVIAQHIANCREMVYKKVDLTTLPQRRDAVINTAKSVNELKIITKNNELIENCEIAFNFNKQTLLQCISQYGSFKTLPVPDLESTIHQAQEIMDSQIEKNMKSIMRDYEDVMYHADTDNMTDDDVNMKLPEMTGSQFIEATGLPGLASLDRCNSNPLRRGLSDISVTSDNGGAHFVPFGRNHDEIANNSNDESF